MSDKSEEFKDDYNLSQLEWVQLREVIDAQKHPNEESMKVKGFRKLRENPFVPIGCIATASCLTYGLYAMKKGDSRKQQLMMRGRVLAQGFTVIAITAGIVSTLYMNNKNS